LKTLCPSLIFLLILMTVLGLNGSVLSSADEGPSADRQFEFSESLFREADYYRAITEYKRFIHYYPADRRIEIAFYRIAESYFKAGRWRESIDAIKVFIEKFPGSDRVPEALLMKGLSEKNLKRYDEALQSFEEIQKRQTGIYRQKALYESALVHVEREDWDRAGDTFAKIPADSRLHAPASRLRSGLLKIRELPEKSPAAAGTMAAVLPGAGHLYTERYRDALVAFLLNGAFIFAAIELFRNDHHVAGGIVTFFEIGLYTGNIYSAVSSAHKYNRRVRDDYLRKLKDENPISLRSDPNTSAKYVMYNFRY
jgi:outer membrane protein assembly factor BamD (BamD/ComL family)